VAERAEEGLAEVAAVGLEVAARVAEDSEEEARAAGGLAEGETVGVEAVGSAVVD